MTSYEKMEVKKEEYHAVSGVSYPSENHEVQKMPVMAQPAALSSIEKYILELDAGQVSTWSPQDVANLFIEKINCGYANEMFLANKINGRALMLLREDHLKEMGIQAIGDRVYMLDMIKLLKKKKKEMETTASLWSGETPNGGCEYSKGIFHCIKRYVCPCCVSRTYWKITGQGVFYRKVPPCRQYFGTVSTEYMDYRFFKDLELKEEPSCCCFCRRHMLEIYVNDRDAKATERDDDPGNLFAPHILLHPEAPKVESIIRNAWNEARLVAE